jgi:hypothetical protein
MGLEKEITLVLEEADPELVELFYFKHGMMHISDPSRGLEICDAIKASGKFSPFMINLAADGDVEIEFYGSCRGGTAASTG